MTQTDPTRPDYSLSRKIAIAMILSRIKPAIKKPSSEDGANAEGAAFPAGAGSTMSSAGLQTKAMPKLEEFLERRDYTGAMTLLELNRRIGIHGCCRFCYK